jgi:hypothetical protein
MAIFFDSSDLEKGILKLSKAIAKQKLRAEMSVADEILRLSASEVPFDTGALLDSSGVEPENDGVVLGYNKVYAARLHENPSYSFKNGRKGKYLEDPIKQNMRILINHVQTEMRRAI